MIKSNKSVGARSLSVEEVTLILPTYVKIQEQIDGIRTDVSAQGGDGTVQRTNNIGILGARGTGKTSVLKTIEGMLKKENTEEKIKNIMLPMIVPENMSSAMNLMAAVLGLFKAEVDNISEKQTPQQNCWEEKPLLIVKSYNDLVKRYCYIQNEYRKIITNEYTTENDYVKRSAEIFNSDIEFITSFQDFINNLLALDNYTKDAMIFLFIDDIDLSTHRCTDIVKTLLSYLSHSRIITFVSGDLDTFEEALTLDFLRQENFIEKDIIEQNFVNDQPLKERKQILAYEYLKKIIPPIYRHTVKKWSLENKGSYIIRREDIKEEYNLLQLLSQTFEEYNCRDFFHYNDYSDDGNEMKPLPEIFHMFDNTSRGLNNVYSALFDVDNILKSETDDFAKFIAIKSFLETIISSNATYNKNRNFLLEDVIQFGTDFESTIIQTKNFYSIILEGSSNSKLVLSKNNKSNQELYFKIFVLIDFAVRILKKKSEFKDEMYIKSKIKIICNLINYPIISGSTKSINEDKMIEMIEHKNYTFYDTKDLSLKAIGGIKRDLVNIFFSNTLEYSLRVYQYIKKYHNIFIEFVLWKDKSSDLEMLNYLYWGFITGSIENSKIAAQALSRNLSKIEELIDYLSHQISPIARINIYNIIMEKQILESEKKNIIKKANNYCQIETFEEKMCSWDSALKPLDSLKEKLLLNTLDYFFSDQLFVNDKLELLKNKLEEYMNSINETKEYYEDQKRLEYISEIENKQLWSYSLSEIIRDYIKKCLMQKIKRFFEGLTWVVRIDDDEFKAAYVNFLFCTDGVSDTIAKKTKRDIKKYGYLEKADNYGDWIGLDDYSDTRRDISHLASNYQAWYGREEAQILLNSLDKLSLHPIGDDNKLLLKHDLIRELEELVPWLHSYASYRISILGRDEIYKQSRVLSDFSNAIMEAKKLSMQSTRTEFENMLCNNSDSHFSISEVEDLFGGGES